MADAHLERRVREVFEEAFDLDDDARRELIASLAESEPVVAAELTELLSIREAADSRFDLVAPPVSSGSVEIPRVPGWQGRYEIGAVMGEGATGTVFSARQLHPPREVAIKVLKSGLQSSLLRDRFELEARILARLDHPGIASILEAGTESLEAGGGVVRYLVMENVAGSRSITEHARAGALDARARIELLARVADAVHHGHQKGVIHRDLKPANVLVTPAGDPKVIDFGVARLLDSDITGLGGMTLEGRVLGSLAYMSPEQAAGRLDIDTRTDVWALGAMLFELMAERPLRDLSGLGWPKALRIGTTPIDEADVMRVIRDRDLCAITLAALSADPARRYPSADALAGELRAWAADEPVKARTPSAWGRFLRLVRKNRIPVAAATSVVVLSLTAALFIWSLYADSRESERLSAQRAEELRRADYFSRTHRANTAASRGYSVEARVLLRDCPEDLRDWEWDWLSGYCGWMTPRIHVPEHRIFACAQLSDGRTLVGCVDGGVRVHERATDRVAATWWSKHRVIVNDITLTDDGRHAGVVYREHGVGIFDTSTGELVAETEGNYALALFSAGGDRLFLTEARGVASWSWREPGPARRWIQLASLPDFARRGDRLFITDGDRVQVHDADTGELIARSKAKSGKQARIALRRDEVITGGTDGWLRSFRADSLELEWTFREDRPIVDVAVSPDERRLAVVGRRRLDLLDAETLDVVTRFRGQSNEFGRVWFETGSDRLLATSAQAYDLQIWDPDDRPGEAVRRLHAARVQSLKTSSDGRRAISMSDDGEIVVWDVVGKRAIGRRSAAPPSAHPAVFLDRRGERAAIGGAHGIRIVDLADGRTEVEVEIEPRVVRLDVTDDLSRALLGCRDGTVRVLALPSGRELVKVRAGGGAAWAVRFIDDGELFVAGPRSPAAYVFRTRDGRRLARLVNDGGGTSAFEHDPRLGVIVGSTDFDDVFIWSASTGETLQVLEGHETFVHGVSLSGDGRRVFSFGGDGIKIWDMETGATAVTIRDDSVATQMVFEPVNRVLITGHQDGTVRFRR